ncbi:MAG: endonuclease domain-containing protein [Alphaproteobacteria bacterium]
MKYRPAIGSTQRARSLRTNATGAERAMWRLLREAFPDARFRRQVPLLHYIVDFASHRTRLVIECDGGQHNEEVDADRTRTIEAEGYRILRFWNNDILVNPEGVHSVIASALLDRHPHPTSPIKGEG